MRETIIQCRDSCLSCNRKRELCLCSKILPFVFDPKIVLLVHPKEYKKSVGTFRIVRLSIKNSVCIRGYGFELDQDKTLLDLVSDPSIYPMILFPGEKSLNIDELSPEVIRSHIPQDKKLVILVIDGTWANARKMIRTSKVLQSLSSICFSPKALSAYKFRKQPHAHCVSTVEAVHALIEALCCAKLCERPSEDAHEKMLSNFHELVKTQVSLQVGPVRY